MQLSKIQEKLNLLEESVKDDLEHFETSRDADAKTDGKELPELVRKSREAGMEVEMVIGDKAYFLISKNANTAHTEMEVIRKGQKRKHTVKL